MKKLITNLSILAVIFFLYKVIIFISILNLSKSKYDPTTFLADLNYGKDDKAQQIILLGSSNTRYDFDYNYLNAKFKTKAVHSVSSSVPFALFFTLDKFINSKWNNKNNTVIIDIPYSLFSDDQFLPCNYVSLRLMTLEKAKEVLLDQPKKFFSFIFNESPFNNEVTQLVSLVAKNHANGIIENKKTDNSLVVSPVQNFKNGYDDCTTPYVKEQHYLVNPRFSKKHLEYIKSYISEKIKCKVYYRFPEINKGNNNFTKSNIDLFTKTFNPINTFEQSQFLNNQLYDQWYHLNKCGTAINTQYLVDELNRLGIKE
ncbi:MAG: hypothetical protein JWR50_458 [Mucilaginibacter sp.]|nr:hypothetical protein [Mucilaginibacter sp.]